MARYFIELSYKGTNYHGWQLQPNALTVQEVLDEVLSRILRQKITTTGSGRTDAGVHALQQYVHFDYLAGPHRAVAGSNPAAGPDRAEDLDNGRSALDEEKALWSINALLPSDIAAHRLLKVHEDAHARFDAVLRSYQYRMHFRKDPFLHQLSWQRQKNFDIEQMNIGAKELLKQEDFAAFCKSHAGSKTTICHLSRAEWVWDKDEQLVFHIRADRFLRNMVRAIVGTLLDLGRAKISLNDFKKILKNGNRSDAGESVPAEGLYLAKVQYPYINEYGDYRKRS